MYVDISQIVNISVFETINELAVCSICTGLVIEPKQCNKCENSFCAGCINSWISKSKTCPFKCEAMELKDPSRTLKIVLNKLIIKCDKECQKEINYESFKSHVCQKAIEENVKCMDCKRYQEEIMKISIDFETKIKKLESERDIFWQENQKLKYEIECIKKNNSTNLIKNPEENDLKAIKEEVKSDVMRSYIMENNQNISEIKELKESKIKNKKKNDDYSLFGSFSKLFKKSQLNQENSDECTHINFKKKVNNGFAYVYKCCDAKLKCSKCHKKFNHKKENKGIECINCSLLLSKRSETCQNCNKSVFESKFIKI